MRNELNIEIIVCKNNLLKTQYVEAIIDISEVYFKYNTWSPVKTLSGDRTHWCRNGIFDSLDIHFRKPWRPEGINIFCSVVEQ